MSLRGEQTHHHSLLAGVGAGTAGVLVVLVLLLLAWHRIAGAVGAAASVIIWAVAAMVIAAAVYGVVFLALRLRLHAQRPETLTRYTARAGTPASPQVLPVTAGDGTGCWWDGHPQPLRQPGGDRRGAAGLAGTTRCAPLILRGCSADAPRRLRS